MIEDRYNKTVSTKRMTGITATKKEKYATYLTGIDCLIQPYSQAFSEDIDGSTGKDYTMFCEIADIKEGDEIVDTSKTYKVIGVNTFEDSIGSHHIEAVIREYKQWTLK